jgi:predicted TIM-barrel fold metal-dependent hydrolase
VILHCDIDMPFAKQDTEPVYLTQMKALLKRHPKATIIWAHTGLGRIVHPPNSQASGGGYESNPNHRTLLAGMLEDPALSHVYFDISWDEVAKYVVSSPEATQRTAALINRHADRFLFGTDEVAPTDQQTYLRVYRQYDPLWRLLTPEAQQLVKHGNYERLFDAARTRVRAWERANVPGAAALR